MEIRPRYDHEPLIVVPGPVDAIVAPLVRQRERFAAAARSLSAEQWSAPSRCAGWTAQDVVTHLIGTNAFWEMATAGSVAGTPTRMLVGFDPKATPAMMVEASRGTSPGDTLAQFEASTASLCAAARDLTADQLSGLAEAPPGWVTLSAMLHHALWDCWVHERDVFLPLGIDVDEQTDEIRAALAYALALGPSLVLQDGATTTGKLTAIVTDPEATFTVTVDGACVVTAGGDPGTADVEVTGAGAAVLDGVSVRGPVEAVVRDESKRWLLDGLATAFEEPTR